MTGRLLTLSQYSNSTGGEGKVLSLTALPGKITEMLSQY